MIYILSSTIRGVTGHATVALVPRYNTLVYWVHVYRAGTRIFKPLEQGQGYHRTG